MAVTAALLAALAVLLAGEALAGRPARLAGRVRRAKPGRRPTRQVWLSQAGATVTPAQFWAVCAATAGAVFAVLYLVDSTLVVALVPAVGSGCVPYLFWSSQRRQKANARVEAWPDAIRQVTGALKAGTASLHDAVVALGDSGPVALRAPMGRYARLADRVGQVTALEAVRAELADPVSDSVLLSFEMAAGEGTGTVLAVLEGLGGQISADLALHERIRTVQTQSRIAAVACAVLPYGLLVFLSATTTFFRGFYSTAAGVAVVALGAVCSAAGFVIVRRLARPIATAERVFVRAGRP